MFCKNCGTQLPDGAQFCANCGSSTDPNAPVKPARTAVLNEKYQMPTWKILYLVAVGLLLLSMIFFFVRNMSYSTWGVDVNYSISGLLEGDATIAVGSRTQDGVQIVDWLALEGLGNLTLLLYVAAVVMAGLPFIPMLKFKFNSKLLLVKIANIWALAWMFLGTIFVNIESLEYDVLNLPNVWGWIFILLAGASLVLSFMVSGKMKKQNAPAPAAPVYYPVQ
ncbi:MAG: zinc-ribbon domain-containing protein [Clostridia bacterium]|nr:zinc-ribbon domain-containing protein [Clostridia bacterium]